MYIDIEKNEYPLSVSEIQERNPNTMMPHYLDQYKLVKFVDQPTYDQVYEKLVEGFPTYDEDKDEWVQVWDIVKLPDDIVQSNLIQEELRNRDESLISVTRRQGLLALFKLKKIKDSDIDSVIDTIEDEDMRYEARINWIGANTFENHSEFVHLISELLQLSEEDIDNLFNLARTL